MTEREFARAVLAVKALPFVDEVNVPAHAKIVFVELSPRLIEVLPVARQVLQVAKDDFSVEEVTQLFQVYVVEYLDEIADLSHQLLREAQRQAIKKARS